MNPSVMHKLLLARRLFHLGEENLASNNDLSLSIGVNLLQDSVEAFLLAVSEHVNAGIQAKTPFEQYFGLINIKIGPKKLPFRVPLTALNKLRVNSKHFGLAPAKSETERMLVTVREFLDEVTQSVLGLSFASVSLIDLLRDGEAKCFLKEAEVAFANKEYESCLVACRKAVFVTIESEYDVAPFGTLGPDEQPFGSGRVPHYARNKKYIEERVKDATDYIVLDHDTLELDLMRFGMDNVSFWNVWRLTPSVYRKEAAKEWIIKREFGKLDKNGLKERTEYVLDATISLLLSADQRIAAKRSPKYGRYFIDLRNEQVPVYEKADSNSKVVSTTPKGLKRLFVDFQVPSLNGEGMYWHVVHVAKNYHIWGYISNEVVDLSNT